MAAFNMNKGQATIEFLLVLVISLAYIVAIIQPNADIATSSMSDVSAVSKLRFAAEKIAGSVEYSSASGLGTRQTFEVAVPADGNVFCNTGASPTKIRIQYQLKSGTGVVACENDGDGSSGMCTKFIEVGKPFSCSPSTISYGIYRATVEKVSGTTSVKFDVMS